jgi:hypothetical protein
MASKKKKKKDVQDDADVEFEKNRAPTAMTRKKHM